MVQVLVVVIAAIHRAIDIMGLFVTWVTLRDLMAVHWARSRAIMTARDAITEGIVEASKRKISEA